MRGFFEKYADGFVRRDVGHLATFFAYPCMITNEAGTDLICDAAALGQHVEGFIADVHGQGLAHTQPTVLDDRIYGDVHRVTLVRWELFNRDGAPLEEPHGAFTYLYILANSPAGWRIQLANLL